MNMKRTIAMILALLLMLSMAGCGSGSGSVAEANGTVENPGTVAQTHILTKEDLAKRDGTDVPDETEPPETDPKENPDETEPPETNPDETEPPETDPFGSEDPDSGIVAPGVEGIPDNPDVSTKPVEDLNPVRDTGYRYQSFVLNRAGESNAVLCTESMLMSMTMWRNMITGTDGTTLQKYISRDYMSFEDTDGMTLLNRIWTAPAVKISGDLAGMVQSVNMGDPSATTTKNSWVSEKTGGYITYTPSSFSDSTEMDLMSVMYMHGAWSTGLKPYDTQRRIFYNANGKEQKTVMFTDECMTYWDLGNAKAYCMYLTDGNYIMFIVTNDRTTSLADVDITGLMDGSLKSTRAHAKLIVPEFTTESTYQLTMGNFSLATGTVDTNVVSGLSSTYEPTFSQIAKITVNRAGVGNVTVEGSPAAPVVEDTGDIVEVLCDHSFMYYVGDTADSDIAFFGVFNNLTADMAVKESEAGIGG